MKRLLLALCIAILVCSVGLSAATHRVSILGWQVIPDSSGDVFFEPYPTKATNDRWDHGHFIFNDTATKDCLYGVFNVPNNYSSGADLIVVWTTTATSGDVEWDFAYRAVGGNDTESLDQAGDQQAVNANDTAPSATDERMEITIALTDGNFAANDTVTWEFCRDGTDGGDGITAAVQLVELLFEFDDA